MTNPTSAVNPSDESIAALRERPDDDPIVMVNLLKYAEPGGRERYARYGAVAGREIAARGGRVLYSGTSLAGDHWDGVALVYYPRRAAWLDMQDNPAYQAAIADRTAGLSARLLYAFTHGAGPVPVTPPPLEDVQRESDDEVFVVNLLRYPRRRRKSVVLPLRRGRLGIDPGPRRRGRDCPWLRTRRWLATTSGSTSCWCAIRRSTLYSPCWQATSGRPPTRRTASRGWRGRLPFPRGSEAVGSVGESRTLVVERAHWTGDRR